MHADVGSQQLWFDKRYMCDYALAVQEDPCWVIAFSEGKTFKSVLKYKG